MVIILMGAAGAGKTTVGRHLSNQLGWLFLDGDALHPPENIVKMAHGIPLTDVDRRPWLQALHKVIGEWIERDIDAALACSLLTRAYRAAVLPRYQIQVKQLQDKQLQDKQLQGKLSAVKLVHLRASRAILQARLTARAGHFAGVALLDSQLALLEEPVDEDLVDALVVDASQSPDQLVERIRHRWNL